MSEKRSQMDQEAREEKDRKDAELENKILSFLLPIVGGIAFILGLVGFILTLGAGKIGITVFYAILFALGLLGVLYGVLIIIRLKNPDFLRKQKKEKEDTILAD